ncbi:protein kinase domain-containing protein [Nannocystis pusilla]|uniref:protein kinase domain-containing protein n=1 Tax=Nannocystis pusilla TaxID=889268 RepID=UPI003B831995
MASANTGEEEPIHLTASGHFVGTAHYAAPEAIEPELFGPVDARADVYGLGVILYQGVTGKLPHDGQPRALCFIKRPSRSRRRCGPGRRRCPRRSRRS